VFNYGQADAEMTENAFESLRQAGIYGEAELADPERVANIKAELMTLIADKSIESEKAVNRFTLLIEKIRDVEKVQDPEKRQRERRHVDQLMTFSSKAVFGEAGGLEKMTAWAASEKDVESLRADIEDWVGEQIQKAREKEKGQKDLREQLIELHVRVWYYQQEIARLGKLGGQQEARIVQLEKERDRAEKERRAILDVRKNLGG
jgi:hypothetical protein